MSVTPLYAAFFGLLLVALSWRVQALRQKFQLSRMQEQGHSEMAAATRAVSHIVEYTPLALLLMLMAEIQDTNPMILHALGMTLFVARALHLKGLKDPSGNSPLRKFGTRLVWAQIVAASLLNVAASFGFIL